MPSSTSPEPSASLRNADQTPHSLAKDHPDWLQRKITGEPAIFGGGTAFWIRKGDEDVWISPYASRWRKIYMERVRQIAATGIDGIYIDIPYWMTHFDGWENTWASFDDYTVAEFKKQTGLDAKNDRQDSATSPIPNFRKWVDFRIDTFTDFLHEIDQNAKSVNPEDQDHSRNLSRHRGRGDARRRRRLQPVSRRRRHRPRIRIRQRRSHGVGAHATWTGFATRLACIPSAPSPKARRHGF